MANCSHHADDFIVTAHSKEYILEAKKVIETWLKERNLELSAEKTRIVHTEDGFDFLGFNLRTYKGKALLDFLQKYHAIAFSEAKYSS